MKDVHFRTPMLTRSRLRLACAALSLVTLAAVRLHATTPSADPDKDFAETKTDSTELRTPATEEGGELTDLHNDRIEHERLGERLADPDSDTSLPSPVEEPPGKSLDELHQERVGREVAEDMDKALVAPEDRPKDLATPEERAEPDDLTKLHRERNAREVAADMESSLDAQLSYIGVWRLVETRINGQREQHAVAIMQFWRDEWHSETVCAASGSLTAKGNTLTLRTLHSTCPGGMAQPITVYRYKVSEDRKELTLTFSQAGFSMVERFERVADAPPKKTKK